MLSVCFKYKRLRYSEMYHKYKILSYVEGVLTHLFLQTSCKEYLLHAYVKEDKLGSSTLETRISLKTFCAPKIPYKLQQPHFLRPNLYVRKRVE